MKAVAITFMGITTLLHIFFFKLESIDFMKPEVLGRFGLTPAAGGYVKTWAYNQGFYNLFLAIGLIYAIFLYMRNDAIRARAVGGFISLMIVGAGVVLFISAPLKVIPALAQALPALLAFIFMTIDAKRNKVS